jgi:DNA-binding CsgD family transcriptional regulator
MAICADVTLPRQPMASSRLTFTSPEHMLRVLHGHLQKKRSGLMALLTTIEQYVKDGRLSPETAEALTKDIRRILRTDEELTTAEREILERDGRYEQILRTRFPTLSDTFIVICVCTLDGLSTREIASIVGRAPKTVDHYRQEIREMIGTKGTSETLREALERIVGGA